VTTKKAPKPDPTPQKAYMLRTCAADGTSHGGFRWPKEGPVSCPDWDPKPECGHGLHGLLWGGGNLSLLSNADDAIWQIVEIEEWVEIDRKVKVPRGAVVYSGDMAGATVGIAMKWLDHLKKTNAFTVEGGAAIGGSSKLAASGYSSQLAAIGGSSKLAASGDYSKLAASGDYSQLAASGDYSKLAASGDYSQLAASGYSSKLAASGDSSKLAASGGSSKLAASGYSSKLAASGDSSKLAASGYSSQLAASGDSSQLAASGGSSQLAASGDYSQLAASGDYSQLAASGDYSIAMCAGPNSTAAAGTNGTIALTWWDAEAKRFRVVVGYVGEDGIEAGVFYRVENGKLAPTGERVAKKEGVA